MFLGLFGTIKCLNSRECRFQIRIIGFWTEDLLSGGFFGRFKFAWCDLDPFLVGYQQTASGQAKYVFFLLISVQGSREREEAAETIASLTEQLHSVETVVGDLKQSDASAKISLAEAGQKLEDLNEKLTSTRGNLDAEIAEREIMRTRHGQIVAQLMEEKQRLSAELEPCNATAQSVADLALVVEDLTEQRDELQRRVKDLSHRLEASEQLKNDTMDQMAGLTVQVIFFLNFQV